MDDRIGERTTFAFLFTDIEGSTRLWEDFPAAMAAALTRHDDVLRSAVREQGGQIYRSAGDAIQACFPQCRGAIQAAIEAQQVFRDIEWGIPEGVRVRMAIDLTTAERTPSGDYRSPRLRRLEAILAIAHGGQVLVSNSAATFVHDRLPPGTALLDLGTWQLPGIGRSEPIYQIVDSRVPLRSPTLNAHPVASSDPRKNADRFVGRKFALRELHQLIDKPGIRLLTLTGPGGIGKTRLAQQLAYEMQSDRGLNVWFVELTGLSEPEQVLSAIAVAMRLREAGDASVRDMVVDALHRSDAVLVLDNFEHLLPAATSIAELLSRVPRLRVVVSSRTPLKLRGERQFPVEPLAVPSANFDQWEEVQTCEAVQLFVERAIDVIPTFELGSDNAGAVVGICRKLEGIPLAIELAVPRLRRLSLDELDERLEDRLGTLATLEAHLPDRHQAMRASIDWSYELLSDEQRWFVRQLGVFQSGFDLETLERIFRESGDTLQMVESLLEQNLLQRGGFQRDPDRFFMLETVRQYALEQLEKNGEANAMRARHARYFAGQVLDRYSDQRSIDATAVRELRPALLDLSQSISWLTEHDPVRALDLGAGAWRLWCVAGQQSASDRWLEPLLRATRGVERVERVRALYGRAIARHYMGDMVQAEALDRESLELARKLDDDRGIGDAINHLAGVKYMDDGNPEHLHLLDQAMAAYERIGDQHGIAEVLLNRAAFAMLAGRNEDVLADGLRILDYCRAEGKDALASNTIQGVAEAAHRLGNGPLAASLIIEALELNRKLEFDVYTGANLQVAAGIALDSGAGEVALRLVIFADVFAQRHALVGDMADPFGRADELRERIWKSLDDETVALVIGEAERLSTGEAVEQALSLLHGLDW